MENNNMQPEYLNPQSDKYYNGFRYEKDKYGTEYWYDDNGNCRKEISYYDNGDKKYEIHYNENEVFHNEDGYAYQYWSENGDIKRQDYYLNGKELTEQEWKKIGKNTKNLNTKTMKNLYLLSTSNLGDFYVIAKDPTEAENALTEIFEKTDHGYNSDRKVTNIKWISESFNNDYVKKDLPNMTDKHKRLLIVSDWVNKL